MTRRPGATLIEVLVAFMVLTVILAGAWLLFTGGAKAGHQAVRYSSVIQAAATLRSRLEQDLATAWIPPGRGGATRAFKIGPQRDWLVFLRQPRHEDPETPGVPDAAPAWVRWASGPGPGGTRVIRREVPVEGGGVASIAWESAPARDLRFELLRFDAGHYLLAEMNLLDADAAAQDDPTRRALPVRVARRLRSPGKVPLGLTAYPEGLLGDLPAPADTPRSLLGGDQVMEVGG